MKEVNKNTELDNTDKKLHISDVSGSALGNNILKVLLEYNDYLFTFIDRDNVAIGTEKEDVIKWYNEHYR